MILKCGNCGSTNLKNIKEHGFVTSIFVEEKVITEPLIYYCYDCGSFSSEEKIYRIGEYNG